MSLGDVLRHLEAIEAALIEDLELRTLGHRLVYDRQTGQNQFGGSCDPRLLDADGVQVRLVP